MQQNSRPLYGVVVAGGASSRMTLEAGEPPSKLLFTCHGRPIIDHTLQRLVAGVTFHDLVVVIPQALEPHFRSALAHRLSTIALVPGGRHRQESVLCGLNYLSNRGASADGLVLIHDGARCLVSPALISRSVAAAQRYGHVVCALPATDTLKIVKDGIVQQTLDRGQVWQMQTPQIFPLGELKHALNATADLGSFTDDCQLLERDHEVHVIEGERSNIKVTTRADLNALEALLHVHQCFTGDSN